MSTGWLSFAIFTSFSLHSVQSQAVWCISPTDCTSVYSSIDLTARSIYLAGYKSGTVNGSITTTDWLYCEAAFSCTGTPLIKTTTTGNLNLRGTQSAFNASIDSATSVDCPGSNSCSYSSIQAGTTDERLYCQGDQACSHSTITETILIDANGAYSLKNATIYSVENELLKAYFYGYHSGFGTKIICQNGHSCIAYCYGHSCDYMPEMQCLGNNQNCLTHIIQPAESVTSTEVLLFDSLALTTANNDIHCEAVGSRKYDQRREYYDEADLMVSDTVPAVCCRGHESCSRTNIEYNGTLICSAYDACRHMDFLKNYGGNIFCSGRLACKDSTIYSRNEVYCLGYGSCASNFISSGTIYCSGSRSCWNAIINSTADGRHLTVYFMGKESMMDTIINCKENDVCHIVQEVKNEHDHVKVFCDGECTVECPTNYNCPVIYPTSSPTTHPTFQPSIPPTLNPSLYPTNIPTATPTHYPTTMIPTFIPTLNPTVVPTFIPTLNPTPIPTLFPSNNPTYQPTILPTNVPTFTDSPSNIPTTDPTMNPTTEPTIEPSVIPTSDPTIIPSNTPTKSPEKEGIAGVETTFAVTESRLQSQNNTFSTFITDNMIWLIIAVGVAMIICVLFIFLCKRKKQNNGEHKPDTVELQKVQSIEVMSETEPGEPNTVQSGDGNDTYSNKNALKYWLNDIGMNEYFDIFVSEGFGDDISQMEALFKLTDDQLKSIGIAKLAHRNLILSKIEKLNIAAQIENRNENEYLLNSNGNNAIVNTNDEEENEEMYTGTQVKTDDGENEEMYMEQPFDTATKNDDSKIEYDNNDMYTKPTKSTNQ